MPRTLAHAVALTVALNLPVREPWAGGFVVRGSDRPGNGLSGPYDRMCASDRLRRGLLWFAVMITSAWRRPLTKILLDRVRDESGE